MVSLRLQSADDELDLDFQLKRGYGIQVLAGATGFGLAPIQTRWIEGAGDGARFRGRRHLPRDIDLPLSILGRTPEEMRQFFDRLSEMLDKKVRLWMIQDDGTRWWLDTHWVGGGQYVYGVDTFGTNEVNLVITLRAGDPFWTSANRSSVRLGG